MFLLSLLQFFWDGLVVGFLASVPLGPIGVLCIQRTLNKGRMSGFVSGIGAASSDFIYAIIAGYSVSFVTKFIEEQLFLIKILGAVILLVLGLKIYLTNPVVQMRKQRKRSAGLVQDYVSTFLLTITNPLAIFLFIAAFSIVGGERNFLTQSGLMCGVFIGASLWWLTLTSLVGLFRKKLSLRRLYWINKIAGSVIIILVLVSFAVMMVKEFIG